jgi:hypothetical protein
MYQELELWKEYQDQIKDQLSKNEGVEANHTELTTLEKAYIDKQLAQWEFDYWKANLIKRHGLAALSISLQSKYDSKWIIRM